HRNLAQALRRHVIVEPILTLENMKTNLVDNSSNDRTTAASKPIEDYPENEDIFDEFEYENEHLKEAKGYFANETSKYVLYDNLWKDYQSSAIYLTNIEELPTCTTDSKEGLPDKRLKKNLLRKPILMRPPWTPKCLEYIKKRKRYFCKKQE
ncbi:17331_t:CDS:2, partial [Gigaspora margarita]